MGNPTYMYARGPSEKCNSGLFGHCLGHGCACRYNDDDFNWNHGISLAATGNFKAAEVRRYATLHHPLAGKQAFIMGGAEAQVTDSQAGSRYHLPDKQAERGWAALSVSTRKGVADCFFNALPGTSTWLGRRRCCSSRTRSTSRSTATSAGWPAATS